MKVLATVQPLEQFASLYWAVRLSKKSFQHFFTDAGSQRITQKSTYFKYFLVLC